MKVEKEFLQMVLIKKLVHLEAFLVQVIIQKDTNLDLVEMAVMEELLV